MRLGLQKCLAIAASLLAVSAAHADVIKLDIVTEERDVGSIFVPVRMGKYQGTLKLDTGASSTRVATTAWNKDLPALKTIESVSANGNVAICHEIRPGLVALVTETGRLIARKNYPLSRCDASAREDLLGLDFFDGTLMKLNFDQSTLEVTTDLKLKSPGHSPVKTIVETSNHPLMSIAVKFKTDLRFGMIDTGADLTAVDLEMTKKYPELFEYVGEAGRATAADGTEWYPQMYRLKKLNFGPKLEFTDLLVLAYDFGPLRDELEADVPIVLGFNALSQFNWEFDLTKPKTPTWIATPRTSQSSE